MRLFSGVLLRQSHATTILSCSPVLGSAGLAKFGSFAETVAILAILYGTEVLHYWPDPVYPIYSD
jgi:hypothetical protein